MCQHFHKPWHHFFDDSVTNSEPYPTTAAFKQELIAFHKTLSFQNISTDRVTSATNNLNQKKTSKTSDALIRIIQEFRKRLKPEIYKQCSHLQE